MTYTKMKRYLLSYALLWITLVTNAGVEGSTRAPRITETEFVSYPGGKTLMYRLYFKDKDLSCTPYSLDRRGHRGGRQEQVEQYALGAYP